jgi:chromosome segregation ATPase
MTTMAERDLEQDVNDLKERTARLDGWRQGAAERYERLEREMVRTREELGERIERVDGKVDRLDEKIDRMREELTGRIERVDGKFDRLDGKVDRTREELGGRIDHLGGRIDRLFWMMLAMLGGLATNLAVVLVRT